VFRCWEIVAERAERLSAPLRAYGSDREQILPGCGLTAARERGETRLFYDERCSQSLGVNDVRTPAPSANR
jgi:hypothetical protein